MPTYPRETTEFVAYDIKVDGVPVTDGVAFSVVPKDGRPGTWVAATILDGKTGIMLQPSEPGTSHVWCRITDNPETPILDCGRITRS